MRHSDWRTRFFSPLGRSTLIASIFTMLFLQIVWSWVFLRFVHYQAQYRSLAPGLYDVDVLSVDEFRQLSDPAQREVQLSDGRTVVKAPIWEKIVLPNYKLTKDGNQYVLVRTHGTAHALSYVEHYFVLFAFFSICGIVAAIWNLRLVARDLRLPASQPGADAVPSE